MADQPSSGLQWVAGLLIPGAVREEVLGDLWERYRSPWQYLGLAMRLAPSLLVSRIRRTADPQLTLIVALLVYLGYLGAAWWANSTVAVSRLAGPAAVTVFGMVVVDAYALRPHQSGAPAVGTVLALLTESAIALAVPDLQLPAGVVVPGACAGLVCASGMRRLLPRSNYPPGPVGRG